MENAGRILHPGKVRQVVENRPKLGLLAQQLFIAATTPGDVINNPDHAFVEISRMMFVNGFARQADPNLGAIPAGQWVLHLKQIIFRQLIVILLAKTTKMIVVQVQFPHAHSGHVTR